MQEACRSALKPLITQKSIVSSELTCSGVADPEALGSNEGVFC